MEQTKVDQLCRAILLLAKAVVVTTIGQPTAARVLAEIEKEMKR